MRPTSAQAPWLLLATASLASLASLWSPPAAAFLCTRTAGLGPSVAWSVREVVMRRSGVGNDGGIDEAAIDRALERGAAQWSGLACSDIDLVLGAPTSDRIIGFDWHKGSDDPSNQNIVVFRNDTADDPIDAWLHTFGALAITTVTFDNTTGRLLDADIEVNDTSFDYTACDPGDAGCEVAFDLQNTLTHELGHVLGLDHPPSAEPGAAEATMFASAARGDTEKRDLAADDEAGLCTLYPAGEPAGECFGVGRGEPAAVRFKQTLCANAGPDGVALAGVLLGLLAGRPRRRLALGRNATGAPPIH